MKNDERRRYFRITESVGLSIQLVNEDGSSAHKSEQNITRNALNIVSQNDERIERLLSELEDESPKAALILSLLNQKIERLSSVVAIDSNLIDKIAHKIQEVNISACGLAFSHDELLVEGSLLRIEMTLFPEEEKIICEGIVVACDLISDNKGKRYYCRVDFFGMDIKTQEELIQYIVKSQGAQLKSRLSQKN